MRNVQWLLAASLTVAVTGCGQMDYPTMSYNGGGYPGGYAQPAYYQQPNYYQPAPYVAQTRYVPVPAPQSEPPRRWRNRDRDHDGIPDRYEHNN